jgi:hypothetical protein
MLGAALGAVLPWRLVPLVLPFLLLAALGFATRALARLMLNEGAVTLAGCVAIFSGYPLFAVYERSAYAELAGAIFMPLVLLFLLREPRCGVVDAALLPAEVRRGGWSAFRGSVPLALAMAGAWLSNVPCGVMTSYLLAAIALVAALARKSWAPVLRAAAGGALGVCLTAFYLVPAVMELRWVDPSQATDDPLFKIENNWLFGRHPDMNLVAHDEGLHRVSVVAVVMLAVAAVALVVLWLRGRLKRSNRWWWLPLAFIPAAVLFLLLPVSLPVWNHLPELRFLQFPWRWLTVLEAPMAILFAWAAWPAGRRLRWIVASACAILFLAGAIEAGTMYFQPCYGHDGVDGMAEASHDGRGFAGTWEYGPPDSDQEWIPIGMPAACLVGDPRVRLTKGPALTGGQAADSSWPFDPGVCLAQFPQWSGAQERMRLEAKMPRAGYLVLRLRSYPAWKITANGRAPGAMPVREDGLIVVPVSQGTLNLRVDWTTTLDVVAGRWLSLLSVLLLAGLALLERRRLRARLS